ncbi:peroxisomal multifunctional enzyme A-like isoform X1 [Plodia interpunctella]|uniref:peroxisomal multifunctional enzyme A-like isoform X1 n=2 Tax=Plodia interpunctella TaxID=58824 RepID=UPI0023676BC0|nr:peroxisomal multifunctional enzyme A-like [Plodia interpunctella]
MGAQQSEMGHQNNGKADLVTKIRAKVAAADPKKARELGGVHLFNIIKGTNVYSWTLDLNNVKVFEGEPEDDPDCTFTLSEQVFKQLVQGREDARTVMQAGRCSVTGDIMRAMKLEPYIKID